ncbi:MAG: hypothetical protein MZV70_22485 [Desulfobacterales bacterium]|nr:hypothetical protein [Desulfobacterales bacterium]
MRAMKVDVERLQQITQGYAHVGRKPRMEPVQVSGVILDTVSYFSERPGSWAVCPWKWEGLLTLLSWVMPFFLGWVLENLIKNSVAACSTGRQARQG